MADQNPEVNRPSAPSDLPSDLRVSVGGTAPKPNPTPTGAPIIPKGGGGSRWLAIGAAVFLVMLLAGTIYFVFGSISFGGNRGTLKLTVGPAGGDVVIDGKFKRQAVSDLSVKLRAGEHTLTVTKEGYLDWIQEFSLAARETKEINLQLEPTPNLEILAEGNAQFPELVRNGNEVAYMSTDGKFGLINLSDKTTAVLFGDQAVGGVQELNWAPGEPAAMAKLSGTPQLSNMQDNRSVRGRFVPLGERPVQGAPRSTGTSTWLLADTRQTAKGWQPVLLNESVGGVDFSPDGSRIIYFYHTADGERSLITAHPDGGEWERVVTAVELNNPKLVWLNTDRYVLVLDDQDNGPTYLLDLVSKTLQEVMQDRVTGSLVSSSPDGTRVLYLSEESERVAVWNILNNSREKIFEHASGNSLRFVWQTDERFIISKDDGSLWYWDLNGKDRPVQFISAVGQLQPINLLYSVVTRQLLIVESSRVLILKV